MPSRNIIRLDADEQYYHVYARGIDKADIFLTEQNKHYFLYLLSRHLSVRPVHNKQGYTYPHYRGDIELLSYCLMDNHFHLLLYQNKAGSMAKLMQSVLAAYTAYFNRQNKRSGPLLSSRYKASLINKESYLSHISRYIHLNRRSWKYYKFSSLIHIRNQSEPEWLQTAKILEEFDSRQEYIQFLEEYAKQPQELDYTLADD